MGYLGLVPSERSTGETVKRGAITKAGKGRARRILVEAAWSYRHPPRVSREKQLKVGAAPRAVLIKGGTGPGAPHSAPQPGLGCGPLAPPHLYRTSESHLRGFFGIDFWSYERPET
jgi:Transposase IS116/IS110/IS902 family